ncbi:MAG: PQQ-binding-like beta-propeller repeat protein, partial [Limisphaerales bacterium]
MIFFFSVFSRRSLKGLYFLSLVSGVLDVQLDAADRPQWGEAWSHNMVSSESTLPDSFDPKSGLNLKWSAKLGTETYSTPVIAAGRIYIGTNNGEPRDPKQTGDRGVLMCFEEKGGRFLWQLLVPKREEDPYLDWPNTGISSPVTVENDRVYLVSNRGEVLCLNAPDGKIIWRFDLTTGAGIWSHDAAHSSILIHDSNLYLNTGTGVDNTHKRIRAPNAPSLVVIDKESGRLVARDDEQIAPNIFHSTWSSPSLGKVNGRNIIFFAGGNGIVYAFEPVEIKNQQSKINGAAPVARLKKIWQFNFDTTAPAGDIHQYLGNRREGPSNIYGMPVFNKNRVYVAGGGDVFWGKNQAWLKCIDATKTGDITTNGLVWSYPLEKHVLSTPAVYDGSVFIADCGRTMHCVDGETGTPFWTHELKGDVWASPLVADGKVYLGTRSGALWIFAASKEKKILATIETGNPINATATAANGVVYIASMNRL